MSDRVLLHSIANASPHKLRAIGCSLCALLDGYFAYATATWSTNGDNAQGGAIVALCFTSVLLIIFIVSSLWIYEEGKTMSKQKVEKIDRGIIYTPHVCKPPASYYNDVYHFLGRYGNDEYAEKYPEGTLWLCYCGKAWQVMKHVPSGRSFDQHSDGFDWRRDERHDDANLLTLDATEHAMALAVQPEPEPPVGRVRRLISFFRSESWSIEVSHE
jgi:hypothetical protein